MMNLCDGPSKVSEHGGEWSVLFGVWNSMSNQHDAFTRPLSLVWTTSQSYRYTGCAAVTSFGCAAVSCSPTQHYERGLQERLGLQPLRGPLLGGSVLPN